MGLNKKEIEQLAETLTLEKLCEVLSTRTRAS